MNLLRKIGAWLLLVAAVLALIITLAVAIGVWVVRPPLNQSVDAVALAADGIVASIDKTLIDLEGSLADAEAAALDAAEQADAVAADGQSPEALLLKETLGESVGPMATTLGSVADGAVAALVAVDSSLEQAARIPGVAVPSLGDGPETLAAQMSELEQRLADAEAAIANSEGQVVKEISTDIAAGIDEVRVGVVNLDEDVRVVLAGIASFRRGFPNFTLWGALLISGFNFLLAAGQWQLISSAWRNIRRKPTPAVA